MRSGRPRSPAGPLIAVSLAALVVWFIGRGAGAPTEAEACPGGLDPDGFCSSTVLTASQPTEAAPAAPVLEAERVCPSAGYLCAGLEERNDRRIVRWDESTQEITIRIPRPLDETPDAALRLQQAAARGVNVWGGHPFPLRVLLSDRPAGEDFAVRWTPRIGGVELGRVQSRWMQRGTTATVEIREFVLATRNPFRMDETLDPSQVALTAAHEMGHALGLPHSDSERDVMFPTNTAQTLSTRDFRTMEALYSLQNGAEIRAGG